MSWALPGAILFLLGLLLLLGYFISMKVFPKGETDTPGADPSGRSPCEGCGQPGCGGFARALLRGGPEEPHPEWESRACPVVFEGEPGRSPETKAVVRCSGRRVSLRYRYSGAPSCRSAARMAVSPKECAHACLGFGDCLRSCPTRAIRLEQGIARVNPSRCDGCRKCLGSCPLDLIAFLPASKGLTVLCKGPAGPSAEWTCPDGCTACGLCVDACPEGALERTESGLPRWIEEPCNGCGACAEACPQGIILVRGPQTRNEGEPLALSF